MNLQIDELYYPSVGVKVLEGASWEDPEQK